MKEKVLNFTKNNIVGLSVSVALFLLVFIVPQFTYDSITNEPSGMLTVIHILTIIILLGYIGYTGYNYYQHNKNDQFSENETLVKTSGSIISIIIGLFFGFMLMMVVNFGESFQGFFIIMQGGFRDVESIGKMIYFAVPIILTGLSVAFAFRTGLFNIGATGQFTVGAMTAVYIGYKFVELGEASPLLHWGLATVAAIIAGGIWGAIPGVLKAYRNVNEVVTTIMLNYVAMYLNSLVIYEFMFNRNTGSAHYVQETSYIPTANLRYFFNGSEINGSIIIAVIVVIILHIILNKTTFGFELKAVGFNRDAARYSGMNSKRNIIISMVIAGAIAGLAGGMQYLAEGIRLPATDSLLPAGFTGIAIALLGLSSPIGVLLAGLFYGSLQVGGNYLQLLSFTPDLIDIIIAVIIYLSALSLFLRQFVIRKMKHREMRLLNREEGSDS